MRETVCDDCGVRFQWPTLVGRLPARCGECKAAYVRRQEQAKADRRRLRLAGGEVPTEFPCVMCGVPLPWSGKGRAKERCEPCRKEHARRTGAERSLAWIAANPERAKEKQRKGYIRNADAIRARSLADHYKRKYGITVEDRDRMLDLQGGKCAICSGGPNGKGGLHVDHCHKSNRIRGLLCHSCNTLLGLAGDDPARLEAAAEYVRKHT